MKKLLNGKLVDMTDEEFATFKVEQASATSTKRMDPISPLEFMERFTKAERATIRAKSNTNTDLADFFDLLRATTRVTLDDPKVVAGVDLLVSLSVITAARKAEILSP